VALPLRVVGRREDSYYDEVTELLGWVGLGDRIWSLPPALSGGEKQRAAIARALLKQAPILILDDATSSVDMETETRTQRALRDLEARATTFIIAHRISSVLHADQILIMDHGQIVERGRHAELMRRGGLYAEYFRVQYGERSAAGVS
jgi:ABC-type multidrug transport system fused ATPase/permease subunit